MSNKSSLLYGILGGLISSGLVVGGYAFYNNSEVKNNEPTKVSNVEYNVNTDLTKVISKVKGGVVSVINLQKEQSNIIFDNDKNKELETVGEGSGVIYKKDGDTAYIVTNNHVVEGSDALKVILNNGKKVKAELVGSDEYTDLAVLKIKSDQVKTVLEFGNSNAIKVGEPAIAIGSPLGSEYADSVTEGIISAKNRMITTKAENGGTVSLNAIQTDAAINPGNSGGPLINAAGQVIGINSIKISNSGSGGQTSVEGMGFAIPSNDVVKIINQLERNGKIERPALGISMLSLDYISAEQRKDILNLPENISEGVVVTKIQNESPAAKSGIKKYDVITKVDGEKIISSTDLQNKLYQKKIGDDLKLTVYENGNEKEINVKLDMAASNLK